MIEKIDAVVGKFTKIVSVISAAGFLGVMLVIVCDVVKRYIANEVLLVPIRSWSVCLCARSLSPLPIPSIKKGMCA